MSSAALWQDVNLADVNPNFEKIPAGEYDMDLLPGARYTERGEIKVAFSITKGEETGRMVFASYPDPRKFDWSPKALKSLEVALGVESVPGEDKVEWLNRAVRDGGGHVHGRVVHRPYTKKSGESEISVDLKLFSLRAAV